MLGSSSGVSNQSKDFVDLEAPRNDHNRADGPVSDSESRTCYLQRHREGRFRHVWILVCVVAVAFCTGLVVMMLIRNDGTKNNEDSQPPGIPSSSESGYPTTEVVTRPSSSVPHVSASGDPASRDPVASHDPTPDRATPHVSAPSSGDSAPRDPVASHETAPHRVTSYDRPAPHISAPGGPASRDPTPHGATSHDPAVLSARPGRGPASRDPTPRATSHDAHDDPAPRDSAPDVVPASRRDPTPICEEHGNVIPTSPAPVRPASFPSSSQTAAGVDETAYDRRTPFRSPRHRSSDDRHKKEVVDYIAKYRIRYLLDHRTPWRYENLSIEKQWKAWCRADREFILPIVVAEPQALQYAPTKLLKDSKFMLEVVAASPQASLPVAASPQASFYDAKSMLSRPRLKPHALQYASSDLLNDSGFMLKAVLASPQALQYVPTELLKDSQFMLHAVAASPQAWDYVPTELLDDSEFMLKAAKASLPVAASRDPTPNRVIPTSPAPVRPASPPSSSQTAAVVVDEMAYSQTAAGAHETAYDLHKKLVMEDIKYMLDGERANISSVGRSGRHDEWGEEDWKAWGEQWKAWCRADREFILAIVVAEPRAMQYVPTELLQDSNFMSEAVAASPQALQYVPTNLLKESKFMVEAVAASPQALQYVPPELRGDRKFVLEAVRASPQALQYASKELLNDSEFMLEAVEASPQALQYASTELLEDRGFVSKAVAASPQALQYVPTEVLEDREFAWFLHEIHDSKYY